MHALWTRFVSRLPAPMQELLDLLLPALRRGLTLAAATCIGEFAATLFLSRPEWQTLTTLIYRYLGTAGADNHDRAPARKHHHTEKPSAK